MKRAAQIIFLFLWTWNAAASIGDVIGNGGGVWACSPHGSVNPTKIFFVDFFEAREQHPWTLLQARPDETPIDLVDRVLVDVKSTFPAYAPLWESALNQIKANTQYISDNAELEVIDDHLAQLHPSPQTCPNGLWEYKQWANFNKQGQVLISELYWKSPLLSIAEKAGLIWHEAIYLWFRNSYRDSNSVRARILTGLIFADNVNVEEKRQRLNSLLQAPTSTGDRWFCSLQNNLSRQMFGAYASSELEASTSVLQICQSAGESFHCQENNIKCTGITTDRISWVCKAKNSLDNSVYLGRGREKAEAAFRSQESCQLNAGQHQKRFCVDREPVCSPLQL